MIILGYSGLDGSVRYARRAPDLRPGEERMVQGFDSAAAIIVDGKILAAAAEERFCGEKHTNAFPAESIRYCLSVAGITANQIDVIAHGFNYRRYASMLNVIQADHYHNVLSPCRQIELWHDRFGLILSPERFISVQHHLAHGASAYFPSGFKDALCVVCDGMGEVESLSIYAVHDGVFELLNRHPVKDSLGILYGLVTFHLGFSFNADEYKVMGLAPYGNPAVFRKFFDHILELEERGGYHIRFDRLARDAGPYHRGVLEYLERNVITRPDTTEVLPKLHCDFAAAAQECLERALLHVMGYWREQSGLRNLCMAGGVALNCTVNGKLAQSGLFDAIYVQPAAGDDGTALGAALATAHRMDQALSPTIVGALPFYGPSFSKEEIMAAVGSLAEGLCITDLGSEMAAADDAAAALAADQIVSWFQGRMEYGPRALGNRSILANPLIPDIKDRLNRIIKLREGFRPFAPAVAIAHAREYFDFAASSMFDYMLASCPVTPEWRDRLPGITHVDGSARMQTVDPERNPLFHQLISTFGQIAGVYCLVNTSFNVRGQPIIVSPEIAIETFRKVDIDRLYLGSVRLSKQA